LELTGLEDITAIYAVVQICIGFILGTLIGLTGMGAGVLIMPVLLFVSKIDAASAVGTSMMFSLLSRGTGVLEHWRMGMVATQTTIYFSIGSLPFVLLFSWGVNKFKTLVDPEVFDFYLTLSITVMLAIVIVYLLWDSFKKDQKEIYRCDQLLDAKEKIQATISGSVIGAIVGTTSIGGGIFIIPLLGGVFKLSPQCVVGSSIMMSAILSLAGSGIYLFYGNMNFLVAILLVIGSIPGVKIGCKISSKISQLHLKRVITGVATLSLVAMVYGLTK